MDRVIGIDLGTTNSCVAVVDDGVPLVISNKGGYRTTPSMVALTVSGRRLVGHMAKRQMITNPQQTVFASKRFIGRKWTHEVVQDSLMRIPYTMVEGPHNDVRIQLGGTSFAVPEISALVLSEMKKVAEEYLGTTCNQAVVTVPAYFNDGQRQATKDAGRIAGMDVLRIINEPTAAALVYGFGKQMEKRIAVFDLGGGTFDISILEISSGVFEVMATAGDTFLGGEDFDQRISDWLVYAFAQENGVDPRADLMAMQRIKDIAEKSKCELSYKNEVEINLPFLFSAGKNKTYHLQRVLTRPKLEELTVDLVERTLNICERTMHDAGLRAGQIDDVILVGGQSRMPLVQREVARYFGRQPSKNVHPDEVVALGAAIQGYALLTEQKEQQQETLLLDVTPHALGVMIVGGFFQILIDKNTTVPTDASHIFTTVKDGQTSVRVMVFQGESRRASDNELLGEFILTGLREALRGEVEIEISFEINSEGIVSVHAKDLETGRQQSIVVTATSGLTEDEIAVMVDQNRDYMLASVQEEHFEKMKSDAEAFIGDIQRVIPMVTQLIANSSFGTDAISKAMTTIERAKMAIERKDMESLGDTIHGLHRTQTTFRDLVNRVLSSNQTEE